MGHFHPSVFLIQIQYDVHINYYCEPSSKKKCVYIDNEMYTKKKALLSSTFSVEQ